MLNYATNNAFNLGFLSCENEKSLNDNPYQKDEKNHQSWIDGFLWNYRILNKK